MAEQKKCKHCSMMIPADAKICSHCRKTQGISFSMGCLTVLAVIFLIGFMSSLLTPKPSKDVTLEAQKAEIITITAEQLYKEYEANEIAADQKYKNKTLNVASTISVIGKTIGDTPYINLATGTYSHQVMVTFPAEGYNDKLATYSTGTQIEVTGRCLGKTLGMVYISLR